MQFLECVNTLRLQQSFILHEPSRPGCTSLMLFSSYFKQISDASTGCLVVFLYVCSTSSCFVVICVSTVSHLRGVSALRNFWPLLSDFCYLLSLCLNTPNNADFRLYSNRFLELKWWARLSRAVIASTPELSCLHATFPCLTCRESDVINQCPVWDIVRGGMVLEMSGPGRLGIRAGVLQDRGSIH